MIPAFTKSALRTARTRPSRALDLTAIALAAGAFAAVLSPLPVLLAHCAALARVALPLAWPNGYGLAVSAAGALWSSAFLLYLLMYLPLLIAPRMDGRPG